MLLTAHRGVAAEVLPLRSAAAERGGADQSNANRIRSRMAQTLFDDKTPGYWPGRSVVPSRPLQKEFFLGGGRLLKRFSSAYRYRCTHRL